MSGRRPLTPQEAAITRRMASEGKTSHAIVLALRDLGTRRGEGTIRGTLEWQEGRIAFFAAEAEERERLAAATLLPMPRGGDVIAWVHPMSRAAVSLPKLSFQPAGWEQSAAEWWAS